jgi:hypothetical protein
MKKNNNKVSQHKIKRAEHVLRRKQRLNAKIEAHVEWLYTLIMAGKELDMEKLMYKTVISKLTGKPEQVRRNEKTVKLILAKLTSKINYNRKRVQQ